MPRNPSDVPTTPIADADITPPVDPPIEPVAPVMTTEVLPEIPLTPTIPTATPIPTKDITISAPLETIVPPASKDATPSVGVAAPADTSSKAKKVVVTKPSTPQKGPGSSSQPNIADAFRKGVSSTKPVVTPTTDT